MDQLNVEFTHRSVTEFLETGGVRDLIASHLKGFDVTDALSQPFLASLWFEDAARVAKGLVPQFYLLIKMRQKSKADQEPFRFLECVKSAVVERGLAVTGVEEDFGQVCIWERLHGWYPFAHSGRGAKGKRPDLYLSSPMYVSEYFGFHEYPA